MEPNTNNEPPTAPNPPSPPEPPAPEPSPPTQPLPPTLESEPPTGGIVVGGGFSGPAAVKPPVPKAEPLPPTPAAPQTAAPPPTPTPPAPPTTPPASSKPRRRLRLTKPVLAVLAVLLLGGGFAGYYFGYKTNPSVIYGQTLKHTAMGLDKLIDYQNQVSQAKYKGSTGSGTFKLKSKQVSTDGSLTFKSDSKNGELKFNFGVAGSRVNADILSIQSQAKIPDIYLKADGLKGLSSLAGNPDLEPILDKVDNSWIVIDHSLFDNLSTAAGTNAKMTPPTQAQLMDEAHAWNNINKQYVFTTNKDKAVFTVTKRLGKEKVDGHSTYHYRLAWQQANVKKYIAAQQAALQHSKLEAWIKANKYDSLSNEFFKSANESANNIKSSDSFDLWADTGKMIIYKVRFPDTTSKDQANNYSELGLDYKGGDNYPFFIAGKTKDGSTDFNYKMRMTLDTTDNSLSFNLQINSTGSGDDTTFTADFSYKPSNDAVTITKPAKAEPLAQLLDELGLGGLIPGLQPTGSAAGGSIQASTRNSERQVDIASLQVELEAFFQEKGYYPSRADMNNSAWLAANMKSLDLNALIDPSSPAKSKLLVATPQAGAYAYQATDSSDRSCESDDTKCVLYVLTATFEGKVNGASTDVKTNLD